MEYHLMNSILCEDTKLCLDDAVTLLYIMALYKRGHFGDWFWQKLDDTYCYEMGTDHKVK